MTGLRKIFHAYPAAGYYEWLPTEDADGKAFKQPYYIHPADATLSFAGLYELWPDPAKDPDDPNRWLWSAAIITHHATWLAGVMNDRTPVPCRRTASTPGSTRT